MTSQPAMESESRSWRSPPLPPKKPALAEPSRSRRTSGAGGRLGGFDHVELVVDRFPEAVEEVGGDGAVHGVLLFGGSPVRGVLTRSGGCAERGCCTPQGRAGGESPGSRGRQKVLAETREPATAAGTCLAAPGRAQRAGLRHPRPCVSPPIQHPQGTHHTSTEHTACNLSPTRADRPRPRGDGCVSAVDARSAFR